VFASFVCLLLLLARPVRPPHYGLAWNLLLAWMPMMGALIVYNLAGAPWRGVILPCLVLVTVFPTRPIFSRISSTCGKGRGPAGMT
jgi:hypothetical protein